MAKDRDKKSDFDEAYMQAWPSFGAWQSKAKSDIRSYLGDIFTEEEKRRLRLRNSDILNIQLIRRLVKWVAGFQADHRKGIKYEPIEGSDDQTASDLTEVAAWVMQRSHGYVPNSRASKKRRHTGKRGVEPTNTT